MFVLVLTPDASSTPIGEPTAVDPRVERCRQVVDVLLDTGMKLVRTLSPELGPTPVRDPVLAYCRLARSLRLTMILETRLAAIAKGGAQTLAAERSLAQAAEEASQDADDEATDDEADGGPEAGEAAERGESDRVERDRESADEIERGFKLPLAELAAAICRDLGLPAAEALEVQTAFAELTANDDQPEPAGPVRPTPFSDLGEGRRRQGGSRWKGSRPRPPDLPPSA